MADVFCEGVRVMKMMDCCKMLLLLVVSLQVPEPRPGSCHNDSRTLPDLTLNFVKNHALMDEVVPAFFGQPILTRVGVP
jgi:Sema domain